MNRRTRFFFVATLAISASSLLAAGYFFPPPTSSEGLTALLVLFGLGLVSNWLAVQIDEEGTQTSFDFIIHLAAVVLVGPFGAGIIGGMSATLYQALATEKPASKYLFNGFQEALAATAAGFIYIAAGGEPGLESLGYPASLPPFAVAAITESGVNTLAVTGIVAASRDIRITETWRNLKGPLILFDVLFSLIGYGIAAVYLDWGPLALILAVIPLLGLRYFYSLNVKLRNLSKDLTRVLVRTIEAQDPYTSGHSIRVSEYAREIAQEMGLGYARVHHIETAALLHDIGKIDRAYRTILKQESPLTDQQREMIEAHPNRGANLLESVRALDEEVLEAIRHHHERYDGDGYPDGLEAGEIPIASRIIMVADTIDAMMTSRSYRDPLDPQDVRRELRMLKGEQFDPDVVEAALEVGIVEEAAHTHLDPAELEMLERSS